MSDQTMKKFTTRLGQKEYIGRDGRLYKMDERFGGGGYDVVPRLPSEDEYNFIRRMMGIANDEPCIVMVGEIFVDGNLKYRDFGVATKHNMPGGNKRQFDLRGLEIATTRAINRAMGQGTAGGWADSDAKYERQGYRPATDSAQAHFLKKMQSYKKLVGEKDYYAVLSAHGYEKSNDDDLCTDADAMNAVLEDMSELCIVDEKSEMDGQYVRDEIERMKAEVDEADYPECFDNLLERVLAEPAIQRTLDDGTTVGDQLQVRYAEKVMDTDFDGLFDMFGNVATMIDSQ